MDRPDLDLAARLGEIETLPALPAAYERIAELAEDPSASATEFAHVISADSALTARLLRIVNSPVYGFPRRIESVTRAIVVLGFETLRQLVLVSSVVDAFRDPAPRSLGRTAFWEHSLATGLVAKSLAGLRRPERAEEIFVAALLHDVGKLVLDRLDPERYRAALERSHRDRRALLETEIETLGTTHPEVGALLLERWRLPRPLVEVVRHHHDPLSAGLDRDRTLLVQAADALAIGLGWGDGGNRWVPAVAPDLLERLSLEPDLVLDALASAEADLDETRSLFLQEGVR